MSDSTVETYRWNRDVYDRAVEAGVFGPEDRSEETVAPLARPAAAIAVSDLLP